VYFVKISIRLSFCSIPVTEFEKKLSKVNTKLIKKIFKLYYLQVFLDIKKNGGKNMAVKNVNISGTIDYADSKATLYMNGTVWEIAKEVLESNNIPVTIGNIKYLSLWLANINGIYDFTKLQINQDLKLPTRAELKGVNGLFDNDGNLNKKYVLILTKIEESIGNFVNGKRILPIKGFEFVNKQNGIVDFSKVEAKTLYDVLNTLNANGKNVYDNLKTPVSDTTGNNNKYDSDAQDKSVTMSSADQVETGKKPADELNNGKFEIIGNSNLSEYRAILGKDGNDWLVSKKVLEDNSIQAIGQNIIYLSLWIANVNGIYDFTKLKAGQELILPSKSELQGDHGLFDNKGKVNKKYEELLNTIDEYVGDFEGGTRKAPDKVFDIMEKQNGIISECSFQGKTLSEIITEAEKKTEWQEDTSVVPEDTSTVDTYDYAPAPSSKKTIDQPVTPDAFIKKGEINDQESAEIRDILQKQGYLDSKYKINDAFNADEKLDNISLGPKYDKVKNNVSSVLVNNYQPNGWGDKLVRWSKNTWKWLWGNKPSKPAPTLTLPLSNQNDNNASPSAPAKADIESH